MLRKTRPVELFRPSEETQRGLNLDRADLHWNWMPATAFAASPAVSVDHA
jgi:hypothetical protein